ncbi:hypothetical protein GF324_05220, partial [bacterium]|nr:hypothetical protein [bacterium]
MSLPLMEHGNRRVCSHRKPGVPIFPLERERNADDNERAGRMDAVHDVELPLKKLNSGKVREIYEAPDGQILIVTTDRLSAFDVILNDPIPGRGEVLNRMSLFWFKYFEGKVRHAVVESEPEAMNLGVELTGQQTEILRGRSVLMKKAEMLPVECIVRGYLAGSGFKDYRKTGAVCGHQLPVGMNKAEKLPAPLYTPSTKAEEGHDENITFEQTVDLVGMETAEKLRDLSLGIYSE